MLTRLVRPQVEAMFARAAAGDAEAIMRGLAPDVEHCSAGDHPLGGVRRSRQAVGLWVERLHRLFLELAFDIRSVVAHGPPWRLTVTVEWIADVTPAVGPPYRNHGAHVIRLRRTRVVALHAYEDSQAVARACAVMAEAGIAEASAPPIT